MDAFLRTLPAENDQSYEAFLMQRRPMVLRESPSIRENFDRRDDSDMVRSGIVAPLNTDVRWNQHLPLHRGRREPSYERFGARECAVDDSDAKINGSSSTEIVVPPLNTDARFSEVLPTHNAFDEMNVGFLSLHPKKPHTHEIVAENFSWHIVTADDSAEIVEKKSLINPIQNQHMCGSCWAMALAACVSDCFVVAGTVDWMPRIAPTYLMMTIPPNRGNGQCDGGNPAAVAVALESMPVCDSSCIDYSWCTNDAELCTSASAANHFRSSFSQRLNSNIPTPAIDGGGACYFAGEKYSYQIDQGSDVFYVNPDAPPETFREMVKAHIVDYGPPMAGYAVLNNFVTGNFTDPALNQGVYFDRADYSSAPPGSRLRFSDFFASESQLSGLHAVRVVGWGLARNVQYDNDAYGDVPYWWAANSWSSDWGNSNGYFKIAMYPYNRFAQFDAQIRVKGYPIGGMILVRCTTPPRISPQKEIADRYFKAIKRIQPDSYYASTPAEIRNRVERRCENECGNGWSSVWFYAAMAIAAMIVVAYVSSRGQTRKFFVLPK